MAPAPSASGLGLVCDNDEAGYSTYENAGSSYNWEVTGGKITSGAGTSWMINVLWGYTGIGYITVTEMTSQGCYTVSDTLNVMIDDCTGFGEGGAAALQIYPNPASD